jgi:hypothetical protein
MKDVNTILEGGIRQPASAEIHDFDTINGRLWRAQTPPSRTAAPPFRNCSWAARGAACCRPLARSRMPRVRRAAWRNLRGLRPSAGTLLLPSASRFDIYATQTLMRY